MCPASATVSPPLQPLHCSFVPSSPCICHSVQRMCVCVSVRLSKKLRRKPLWRTTSSIDGWISSPFNGSINRFIDTHSISSSLFVPSNYMIYSIAPDFNRLIKITSCKGYFLRNLFHTIRLVYLIYNLLIHCQSFQYFFHLTLIVIQFIVFFFIFKLYRLYIERKY